MNWQDLVKYGESLGVKVNPLVARRWLKASGIQSEKGTAAIEIVLRGCEKWLSDKGTYPFVKHPVLGGPSEEKIFLTSEEVAKEKFVEDAIRMEGYRNRDTKVTPSVVSPAMEKMLQAKVAKAGYRPNEMYPKCPGCENQYPHVLMGGSIECEECGYSSTDLPTDIEKEVHPTLMISHGTGLGNGWKYDNRRSKMCYVWDEVVYEGGKLEIGDHVNLDGDVVEIKEGGILKSAW